MEDFFEGPEKTIEVMFHPNFGIEKGLQTMTREQLDNLCKLANCSILSKISSNEVDAYVLSESSLFIYRDKFIMKTCGTTTILHCLQTLIEYADALQMVLISFIYSRKNMTNPTSQIHPHHSFETEIDYINTQTEIQRRLDSNSFFLGPLNSDHLCIYTANISPQKNKSMEQYINGTFDNNDNSSNSRNIKSIVKQSSSGSLNIMMFGLDPSFSQHFFEKNSQSAKEMTRKSGIISLFKSLKNSNGTIESSEGRISPTICNDTPLGCPISNLLWYKSMPTDETSFSPCGYSLNAVSSNHYYTIHITPQESCSYASFETNVELSTYNSLLSNILSIFCPTRFVILYSGSKADSPTYIKEFNHNLSTTLSQKKYKRVIQSSSQISEDKSFYMANYMS